MALSRGASRLFQAVKVAILWPIHVKVEPFFELDMQRIPAFGERDEAISTSSHFKVNYDDLESVSSRRKIRFGDSNNTPEDFARDQAQNVESLTDQPQNAERTTTVSLATYEKAMAEKDSLEAAIRRAADPGGLYKRTTIDTAGLVKNIRKRHRDALEENRRDRNAMRIEKEDLQHRFEDEKDRLYRIIDGQNEAVQLRYEQDIQIREEFDEVQNKHNGLLASNKAKDNRIAELEKQVQTVRETCETVTDGSVESLKLADRRTQYRITCIEKKHQEEMDVLRGWNNTLQDRLNIANRLQPVFILHKAQVGTVCEMHEKMLQMKKANKEELSAKDDMIRELGTKIHCNEREIRDLKALADADREALRKTSRLLDDTRKSLRESKIQSSSYQNETKRLEHRRKVWENISHTSCREIRDLKIEMDVLRAARRDEVIELQVNNESLQAGNDYLRAANKRMDQELESWENGCARSLGVREPRGGSGLSSEPVANSLAKALKTANARADALQLKVNSVQAENTLLRKQPESSTNMCDPQVQAQMERLTIENRELRQASGEVEALKGQLVVRFAEDVQTLEDQHASRTQELESEFRQSLESLRTSHDQFLAQQRTLEDVRNREVVAADHQRELEHQDREDRFTKICKEKGEIIQRKEADLRRREDGLALQLSNAHSRDEDFIKMKSRAEKAEEEACQLRLAASNHEFHQSMMNDQILSLRRDGQRHLDLLNEETSKMAQDDRLYELHSELQDANFSLNSFKLQIDNGETASEALSQHLYGASIYLSDMQLLQNQGRVVLLAQLQAAKRALERLRILLAQSAKVDVGKAIAVLAEPRGDETAGTSAVDLFALSTQSSQPPHPSTSSHKRSGAPLYAPIYRQQDDSTAYEDWGDQAAETGAKLSTPEEILNRPRSQPKSRRNEVLNL